MHTLTADEAGHPWFLPDDHGEARRTRWRRRSRARVIAKMDDPRQQSESKSPLRRLTTCGLAQAPDVVIRHHNGTTFATGLRACGNIWTCPTCSARIRARRENEIQMALTTHCAGGGTIGMMTLTLQHDARMSLAYTIDALNHAWRKLQQRRKYRPMYLALTGTITTMEITTGSGNAGWHPHLHILLLAGPDTTQADIEDASEQLRDTWSRLVNKRTTVYTLEHGLNLTWFGRNSHAAARYVTKLAKELTLNDTKSGNDPFALLDDTSPEATAKFLEYAYATHGRQAHRWSAGLRAALTMGEELTDEELAQDNEALGIELLVIAAKHWNSLDEITRLAWIEFAEEMHRINGP